MNKNTKKYKSLLLLSQGKTQSWIVKHKGYDAAVLCRYVREFLDQGWLKINIKHTNPKTYRATPKAPIKPTEEKGQLLHSGVHTRLHYLRFKMDIQSEMKRKITWDKEVKLKNGVKKLYLFFPTITIEYIPLKDGGTIVIYPHEKYLDEVETDKHIEIVRNDIRIARSWLQRVLLCRLSYPVEISKSHLARPILNPTIMRVLEHTGMIRIGDCWIDASKMGFKFGEIESTDPEKLKVMELLQWSDLNIPIRVSQLEESFDRITNSINTLSDKIDSLFVDSKPVNRDDLIGRGFL